MVWHKLLSKQRRRAVVACFRMTPLYNIPRSDNSHSLTCTPLLQNCWVINFYSCRHRASNMFLEGYKRNWLYTEGYAFEDRMIDDLSVIAISQPCSLHSIVVGPLSPLILCVHPRKQWSKRREKRRKRRKQSQTPSTSSFCISAAPRWQKKGWLCLLTDVSALNCGNVSSVRDPRFISGKMIVSCCPNFSKLDTDHLYMAYADIMAKVSHCRQFWPWAVL